MMTPSENNVLARVKAGFILQGTTMAQWCRQAGVHQGYAHLVAAGKTNGEKAKILRGRLVAAAEGKSA